MSYVLRVVEQFVLVALSTVVEFAVSNGLFKVWRATVDDQGIVTDVTEGHIHYTEPTNKNRAGKNIVWTNHTQAEFAAHCAVQGAKKQNPEWARWAADPTTGVVIGSRGIYHLRFTEPVVGQPLPEYLWAVEVKSSTVRTSSTAANRKADDGIGHFVRGRKPVVTATEPAAPVYEKPAPTAEEAAKLESALTPIPDGATQNERDATSGTKRGGLAKQRMADRKAQGK